MLEVGKRLGVSEKTIYRALVRCGEPRRPRGGPLQQPDVDRVIATYRAERTISGTCRVLGIGRDLVERVLVEAGEPRLRPSGRFPVEEAVERYRAGETLKQLGTSYGVHWSAIAQAFDRVGEPRRRTWSRVPLSAR